MLEQQATNIRDLLAQNQELRDEIKRLKGEQGKPKIKENKPSSPPLQNHSSEKERRSRPLEHHKKGKKAEIKIDREEVVKVLAGVLPEETKF